MDTKGYVMENKRNEEIKKSKTQIKARSCLNQLIGEQIFFKKGI